MPREEVGAVPQPIRAAASAGDTGIYRCMGNGRKTPNDIIVQMTAVVQSMLVAFTSISVTIPVSIASLSAGL